MNLELNFEKQIKRNPNLELFSKNTVELYTDGTATLHYLGDHYNNRVDLLPISSLFDYVDAEIFAYETGMKDVTDFKLYIENVHNDYKFLFNEDEKYVLGVTNKYNYRPGTYDTIKALINKVQRFHQRPAGMMSLFNRISDNQWAYNNIKDKMSMLEAKRIKAKNASGSLVDNIGELIQNQSDRYDKIIESTKQANQMSDYFDMLHFIPNDVEDHVANNNYTYIKLYTVVKCFSKDMTIINNRNEEMARMTVPDTYLMFVRPLWRALTTDRRNFEDYKGSCPGGYHPYLNSVPYYSYDPPSSSLSTLGWGTLCLSSYQDDVLSSMSKHDYSSAIMALMNWNNIYNKDHTNPYASISTVMSSGNFPVVKEDEADRIRVGTGFSMGTCFRQKYRSHQITDYDIRQQDRNYETNGPNLYPYAHYILDECNEKKCPLRHICLDYQNLKLLEESDWPEILEDIIGNLYSCNDEDGDGNAYNYQYHYKELIDIGQDDYVFKYVYRLVEGKLDREGLDYWGNKPVEKTIEEIELEQMQAQIEEWASMQRSQNG
tara:strand:+ start:599 stop:2236 length:1638 start_codon:yes stop_codon:yes gene_type:complete